MGLDMYLSQGMLAPADSPLLLLIEEHLTDRHREMLEPDPNYPDDEPSAYVSGWAYTPDMVPDDLYTVLVENTGVTTDSGSPHLTLRREEGGYRIYFNVGYWRKANHIHNWFVENVQKGVDDCGMYQVHPEMLVDLMEKCVKVTADHSLAPELLPTTPGFFFGSTDYDEYYFRDVDHTLDVLGKVFGRFGSKIYYQSSW
jgi:hypothetical protein